MYISINNVSMVSAVKDFFLGSLTSVADAIKPGPRKRRTFSTRELFRNVECQASSTLDSRTATFEHLDDLEDAVCSGLLVEGNGQLAGATFVDGRTVEIKEDSFVHRNLIHRGDLVRRLLAGIVRSAGLQRGGVQVSDVEWHRESHFHVGVGNAGEGHAEYGADGEVVWHVRDDLDG
jgi:hypothetical protein